MFRERERERERESEKYRLNERRHRNIISRLASYEACNEKSKYLLKRNAHKQNMSTFNKPNLV
jgi:hypothetical protein